MKSVSKIVALTLIFSAPSNSVFADIMPIGHHTVDHKIVFVDSDLLKKNRIIAAPVAGFAGVTEIEAGVPFTFSSKYGTRFYIVPEDAELPTHFRYRELPDFPSCQPPVYEIKYLPFYKPVTSALSTCKLVEANEQEIVVELLRHDEKGPLGFPSKRWFGTIGLILISAVGFAGCASIWRKQRWNELEKDQLAPETEN